LLTVRPRVARGPAPGQLAVVLSASTRRSLMICCWYCSVPFCVSRPRWWAPRRGRGGWIYLAGGAGEGRCRLRWPARRQAAGRPVEQAAAIYASAARTVVHLIVGPARDERCVVLSLSCGARLRPGIRSATALCGCLLRGRGGDTAEGEGAA